MEQGGGVSLAVFLPHPPQGPFVAGGFHIPAGPQEGGPGQGVEPVEGKDEVGQHLEDGVPPADVGLLVEEDIVPLLSLQGGGEVDTGAKKAHRHRAGDAVPLPDVPLQAHRPGKASGKAQEGEEAPGQQQQTAQPPSRRQEHPRIGAGERRGHLDAGARQKNRVGILGDEGTRPRPQDFQGHGHCLFCYWDGDKEGEGAGQAEEGPPPQHPPKARRCPAAPPPGQFLDLLLAERAAGGEGSQQKPRDGALEVLLQKRLALAALYLFPGKEGVHHPVPVFKDAPLAETAEHRIGGRFFPLQRLSAQLHQFPGGDRGVFPNQLRKAPLHLP